jgi:hypothetical protein
MGDGTIDDKFDEKRNPRFRLAITNKDYIEFVYSELSNLCTRQPYIHRTAEQLSKNKNPLTDSTDPSNFSTQYKIQTISHPHLENYEDWYKGGKKLFPKDLKLTPTVLKHWYCCDGSFNNNGHRFYTEIHLSNERQNKNKIEKYFENISIPIDRWRDDRQDTGSYKTSIIFNKNKSKKLFNYMGNSLPGFGYKWP